MLEAIILWASVFAFCRRRKISGGSLTNVIYKQFFFLFYMLHSSPQLGEICNSSVKLYVWKMVGKKMLLASKRARLLISCL
jgi:hypothetical protein